jgi:hypothetical protein
MNWLARLKKLEGATLAARQNLQKAGFVGSAGTTPEPLQNSEGGNAPFGHCHPEPAIDDTHIVDAQRSEMHSADIIRPAHEWLAMIGELDAAINEYCTRHGLGEESRARILAVRDKQPLISIAHSLDWFRHAENTGKPQGTTPQNLQKCSSVGFAGTDPEVPANDALSDELAAARLALFTDRGLSMDEAEAMAARLVCRDLEQDDRRLCLECQHLSGGVRARRCSQWQQIGQVSGPAIPVELPTLLQRCAGFTFKSSVKP